MKKAFLTFLFAATGLAAAAQTHKQRSVTSYDTLTVVENGQSVLAWEKKKDVSYDGGTYYQSTLDTNLIAILGDNANEDVLDYFVPNQFDMTVKMSSKKDKTVLSVNGTVFASSLTYAATIESHGTQTEVLRDFSNNANGTARKILISIQSLRNKDNPSYKHK